MAKHHKIIKVQQHASDTVVHVIHNSSQSSGMPSIQWKTFDVCGHKGYDKETS